MVAKFIKLRLPSGFKGFESFCLDKSAQNDLIHGTCSHATSMLHFEVISLRRMGHQLFFSFLFKKLVVKLHVFLGAQILTPRGEHWLQSNVSQNRMCLLSSSSAHISAMIPSLSRFICQELATEEAAFGAQFKEEIIAAHTLSDQSR